ncbi:gastrula zinc finger protein XlCGF17.1 [Vanessa atalanta]|uniref:gastrula zinc finger protein XlCGF17.1 n=1 Tax=Vanessa atalanta TaxID=42275 RepID=UPI001FCCEE26|nr:gastrula zinc finger protein XlCGF17.1 [Vanessa atalanta]
MTDNKCRVCLEKTNVLINIFKNTDSGMISTNIMCITGIQIHPNDGLPNSICKRCNTNLQKCIDFRRLCEKSDKKLRSALINITNDKQTNAEYEPTSKECSTLYVNNENCEESKKAVISKTETSASNNLSISNKVSQKQQCCTCGKIMSSSFRLKTHLATHTDVKPYACVYCNKKFSLVQNLNVHLRIHTGEKPFSCAVCGKTFAQSSGLTTHKRKHTGQTPYKCVLCPRSFRTVGHLQYHVRRHTGEKKFECDMCSRAFITRSDLKQHIMTHSGEKLHVCCNCGMKFSRASNLKRHVKYSHNEDKSYKCTQCPSKFMCKTELQKHEKKHKSDLKIN